MTNFTMLVRDRLALTAQALLSLTPKVVNKEMTVTILDDRSQEATADLCSQWCRLNEACYIRNEDTIGTGTARNFLIHSSEVEYGRGGYLYLSDNDVNFRDGWLEQLIQCYELTWSSGVRVIGAYNHPYHQPIDTLVCGNGSSVKIVQALALQSMLMRWEVWDKYGPFPDTPDGRVCMGEDVAFTNAIRADGGRIGVVDPPLLVNCGLTNTFGQKIPGWDLVEKQVPPGVIAE